MEGLRGRFSRIAAMLAPVAQPLDVVGGIAALVGMAGRGSGADKAAADVGVERRSADAEAFGGVAGGEPGHHRTSIIDYRINIDNIDAPLYVAGMNDTIHNGLEGIIAAETSLSMVDGTAGELVIAGFPVAELAMNATFEETAFLLWYGELPDAAELSSFRSDLAKRRELPPVAYELLRAAARERTDSMDAL